MRRIVDVHGSAANDKEQLVGEVEAGRSGVLQPGEPRGLQAPHLLRTHQQVLHPKNVQSLCRPENVVQVLFHNSIKQLLQIPKQIKFAPLDDTVQGTRVSYIF